MTETQGTLSDTVNKLLSAPDVDLTKVETILGLQERAAQRDAVTAYNNSMLAAQKEMPRIVRTNVNDQTRSNYENIADILEVAGPIWTKHGFTMSFDQADCQIEGHIRVQCEVAHSGGDVRFKHIDIPIDDSGIKGSANKTQVHGIGSSFTYGRRYLMRNIWNLEVADDDGNAASPVAEALATLEPTELAEITKLIEETNSDQARFLKALKLDGITRLSDIPRVKYGIAVGRLTEKKIAMGTVTQ